MNSTQLCQLTTQLGYKVQNVLGTKLYQDFARLRMRHVHPESTIQEVTLRINKLVNKTKFPSVTLLALQAYAQEDYELALDLVAQIKAPPEF